MRRFIFFLFVMILLILISGCSSNKGTGRAVAKPNLPKSVKVEKVKFDLYLDGTASMKGYVNYPNDTVYVNAIKGIERAIVGNWKQETLQVVKFGDGFTKLDRNDYLKFNQVDFYDQIDTSLQKVVEQLGDDTVSIVVTDLFQTNQDIDSLLIALKDKCFTHKKALGLIGIRSQFNGTIYDVGKNLASFSYTSSEDKASFRPFYFLILGPENEVRSFLLAYKKTNLTGGNVDAKVLLWSEHLGVDNVLDVDKVHTLSGKDNPMAEISTLLPNDNTIRQYRLKDKSSKVNLYMIAKSVLGPTGDAFGLKVEQVEKWEEGASAKKTGLLDNVMSKNKGKDKDTDKDKNEEKNKEKKSKEETPSGSFTEIQVKDFITGTTGQEGLKDYTANIALQLTVNPVSIKKVQGKYRAKLSLVPDKNKYLESAAVFKDWSFEDTGLQGDDLQRLGNKTLQISRFVDLVSAMVYELVQPGYKDLYIYFEEK